MYLPRLFQTTSPAGSGDRGQVSIAKPVRHRKRDSPTLFGAGKWNRVLIDATMKR